MKIKNTKLITTLCALGLSIGSVNAAVIFFDDFSESESGALNGQALINPDTTNWTATNWNVNTTDNLVNSAGNPSSATIAFNFGDYGVGDIISVMARVTNTTSGNAWVGIGFSTDDGFGSNGTNGRNWMLWRGNDQIRAMTQNANFTGPDDVFVSGGEDDFENTLDIRMLYEIGATLATSFITWQFKDPEDSSWTTLHTAAPVSGATRVGFLANGTGMQVHSFEVSLIPEPSTALLGGLGMLFLLRRRR